MPGEDDQEMAGGLLLALLAPPTPPTTPPFVYTGPSASKAKFVARPARARRGR